MTGTGAETEWYLARDGKQYGPLSDNEITKLVQLGHLKPDDLVWMAGFPDWQAAGAVFSPPPPKPAPPPPPAPPAVPSKSAATEPQDRPVPAQQDAGIGALRPGGTGPSALAHAQAGSQGRYTGQRLDQREATGAPQQHAPRRASGPSQAAGPSLQRRGKERPKPARRRGGIGRVITLLLLTMLLGGGALAAYKYRDTLQALALNATKPAVKDAAQPLRGFTENIEALDGKLQKAQLWQLLRREFPDWYQERLKETAKLTAEGRPEDQIAKNLADALVALRRKNADHALAASLPRLKAIADSFHGNIVRLGNFNKVACFAFISQSEAHPIVVDLMQKPEHSAPVQAQLAAVFEAIAEGRRTPVRHLPPRKADYDEVTQILMKKGWKEADLELFSDSAELSKAAPAAVCKLVTDWFEAHLAIKNDEALTRLLVEAVRPVVGG